MRLAGMQRYVCTVKEDSEGEAADTTTTTITITDHVDGGNKTREMCLWCWCSVERSEYVYSDMRRCEYVDLCVCLSSQRNIFEYAWKTHESLLVAM